MLRRSKWHQSITDEAVCEAVERSQVTLDDPGFCLVCGLEHGGVEPDACYYPCEGCGSNQVFGAQEILIRIAP